MAIECPPGYKIVFYRVKAKSGKVYEYPRLARIITPVGEIRTTKTGGKYRYYYEKSGKYNGRDIGEARNSKKNFDKAKERDNYTCQMCGATDKRLHIHHKDNAGVHLTATPNDALVNLITLCGGCHLKLHFGKSAKLSDIFRLRDEGLTYAEIGKIYGVSRQRIHQLFFKNNPLLYNKGLTND